MFITKGRNMQNVLRAIIEDGQQKGEISESESAAEITRMLFIAARGVVYNWCLNDGIIDLKDEMNKIMSRMVDGFIMTK